jgi:hypothetical protein
MRILHRKPPARTPSTKVDGGRGHFCLDGAKQVISHVGNFNFNWMTNHIYDDDAAPCSAEGDGHPRVACRNTRANKNNPIRSVGRLRDRNAGRRDGARLDERHTSTTSEGKAPVPSSEAVKTAKNYAPPTKRSNSERVVSRQAPAAGGGAAPQRRQRIIGGTTNRRSVSETARTEAVASYAS